MNESSMKVARTGQERRPTWLRSGAPGARILGGAVINAIGFGGLVVDLLRHLH